MNSGTKQGQTKELDRRAANGIEVALLWHPATQHVSVSVVDANTGRSFELVLAEDDRALDVFDHPYAYAAHRGVFDEPSRTQPLAKAA
jgi:hypothetical protein